MRKLIHQYLTQHFYVKGSKLFKDTNNFKNPYQYIVTSKILISELEIVFGLNKSQLKWFVKHWIHKQNRGFPFNSFWTPVDGFKYSVIGLPIVRRVFSTTISSELVSVTPMPPPTGFIYAPYIPVLNDLNEFSPTISERYSGNTVNSSFYNRIEISGETIETNRRQHLIDLWTNSGLLDDMLLSNRDNVNNLFSSKQKQIIK